MHALQHAMLRLRLDPLHPILRRHPPRQEHHPLRPHLGHRVNHLLRKLLPPMIRMAVRLVRPHRQARVEHQHAPIRPRSQQPAVLGRRREGRVVLLDGRIDVLQGRRRGRRRADGEAQPVGLVDVVVGVLAENDGFDGGEGRVAGPSAGCF